MNVTLIAAALRALADAIEAPGISAADQPTAGTPAGKPRGRPVKGENAPTAAAPSAPVPAPVASPATTATQLGAAPPAATPAAVGTASITYASLAPTFLAAAKTHKREFVVKCMAKFGATQFDKVPADKLPAFKQMLEAGPQPETNANDVADLMG